MNDFLIIDGKTIYEPELISCGDPYSNDEDGFTITIKDDLTDLINFKVEVEGHAIKLKWYIKLLNWFKTL